jgi:hypothetical protein
MLQRLKGFRFVFNIAELLFCVAPDIPSMRTFALCRKNSPLLQHCRRYVLPLLKQLYEQVPATWRIDYIRMLNHQSNMPDNKISQLRALIFMKPRHQKAEGRM